MISKIVQSLIRLWSFIKIRPQDVTISGTLPKIQCLYSEIRECIWLYTSYDFHNQHVAILYWRATYQTSKQNNKRLGWICLANFTRAQRHWYYIIVNLPWRAWSRGNRGRLDPGSSGWELSSTTEPLPRRVPGDSVFLLPTCMFWWSGTQGKRVRVWLIRVRISSAEWMLNTWRIPRHTPRPHTPTPERMAALAPCEEDLTTPSFQL